MDRPICYCKSQTEVAAMYGKLEPPLGSELQKIVETLTRPGKGILDIDKVEIFPNKPGKDAMIEQDKTLKPKDRYEVFLKNDHQLQLSNVINGVVLNEETISKNIPENETITIPQFITQQNIVCGVKVDTELAPLPSTFNETITHGLDDLQNKCLTYKKNYCQFTRWRCVYKVSDNWPSQLAIITNANTSARFASISQSARMVPMIQLEIKTNGDYSIYRAQEVYEEILSNLFNALIEHHVHIEGIIIALGMVVAGVKNISYVEPHMIADFTLNALRQTVTPAVPAIMFLNVGQSEKDYLINLNAIVCGVGKKPWKLSFCYGKMSNTIKHTGDDHDSLTLDRYLKWCCDVLKCRLNITEKNQHTGDDNDSLTLDRFLKWCCDALNGRLNITEMNQYLK